MMAPVLATPGAQLTARRLVPHLSSGSIRQGLLLGHPARCSTRLSATNKVQSSTASVVAQQPSAEVQQQQQQVNIVLDPLQSLPSSSRFSQPPCWIPPLIFVGITTLFSIIILKNRKSKPAVREADEVLTIPPSPEQDPRAYQRALAKTRQAAHITKAVAFNKAGEPSRAYMELIRALSENSTCRSPLLAGHHVKDDLIDLYKLHIKSSEVPPNFATLLQLQEMLGISQEEAEKIEIEVLQTPGAFTI